MPSSKKAPSAGMAIGPFQTQANGLPEAFPPATRPRSESSSVSPNTEQVWAEHGHDLLQIEPYDPVAEEAADPHYPSPHKFNMMVQDYLRNLSPKKREKALLTQKMYDAVLAVLQDPKDTSNRTAQFRFWAKKMFQLTSFGGDHVICHDHKPVAVKEQIYEVLCHCHGQASHGGRDKTSNQVRRYYSWIPKEIIARFVRDCPFCTSRRTQSGDGPGLTNPQQFFLSLHSDTQSPGKKPVSLTQARANAAAMGHKPYRKPPGRQNATSGSISFPDNHGASSSSAGNSGYQHRQRVQRLGSDDLVHYNDGPGSASLNMLPHPASAPAPYVNLPHTGNTSMVSYPAQVQYQTFYHDQSNMPSMGPRRSGAFGNVTNIGNVATRPMGGLSHDPMVRRSSDSAVPQLQMGGGALGLYQHDPVATQAHGHYSYDRPTSASGVQALATDFNHMSMQYSQHNVYNEMIASNGSATHLQSGDISSQGMHHTSMSTEGYHGGESTYSPTDVNNNMVPDMTHQSSGIPGWNSTWTDTTMTMDDNFASSDGVSRNSFDSNNVFDMGHSQGMTEEQIEAAHGSQGMQHSNSHSQVSFDHEMMQQLSQLSNPNSITSQESAPQADNGLLGIDPTLTDNWHYEAAAV